MEQHEYDNVDRKVARAPQRSLAPNNPKEIRVFLNLFKDTAVVSYDHYSVTPGNKLQSYLRIARNLRTFVMD
jgi:hypothetical protein